jgi:glycosyltransferase involved in cell wall biosynthesis
MNREESQEVKGDGKSDLTVVVFNYNYAEFLPSALNGLKQQIRKPDITLVSDDDSPLNSARDLEQILESHPKVLFKRNKKNLGAVEHFRKRVAEVSTKYYMVHSADDFLIDPKFFDDAIRLLEEQPDLVAVFGYAGDRQKDGRVVLPRTPILDRGHTVFSGRELRVQLAYENVVPAVCVVIRAAVHQRVPPFPIANPHVHDWQQWYLMTYFGSFARLEKVVCHRHIHGNNLSETYEMAGDAAVHVDSGYQQLLERPEIQEEDRRHLAIGRRRHRIRTSPAKSLPLVVLKEMWRAGGLDAAWESVLERLVRRFTTRRKRLRSAFLSKHAGTSW